MTTRIFPVLGGSVAELAVAQDPAHPEDDRPLLSVKLVGFDIALWEALKSRGKSITVTDLYVEGLQVNLVRYKGGVLSYQDILDRQPKDDPAEKKVEEAKPLSPEVLQYVRAVSIDALRIVDAEVRLADHDTPTGKLAEDYVRKLNLRLNDLRLSDPIRVRLEAAVFSEKPNFELETTVGPLPQDLQFNALPHIAGVKVRISDLDLGKLAPYLGPAVPVKVASALLSTQWDVGEVSFEKPVSVAGTLSVRELQLAGGKKFDLSLVTKAQADLKNLGTEIDKLDLEVGTVKLAMSGALLDLAKVPRFKDFTAKSTTLDLEQLLAYYPAAAKSLPPGTRLQGIATLDAKASGDAGKQTVVAAVDLSALDILVPGTFVKPKGTPLKLSVNGDFTTKDATLRQLGLVLDELDLGVKGTVKGFDKPVMDLTLAAKPFSFDRIVRLLPQASQALAEQNAKASGDGSIAGHLKGSMTDLDAAFDLNLTGVKLDIPGTHLDGALTVSLALDGNPKKDLKAAVVVDADKAVIQIKDTLDKTAKTPLSIQLDADRRGDLVTLKRLSVLFAELKLDATGTLDLGKGTTALNVSMPRVDLEKLSKTVTAIPADKAKKAFFDANVGVVGNPNKLETIAVELNQLDVRIGRSDLQGTVKIANLVKPRAQIDVRSQLLDLDELQELHRLEVANAGEPGPARAEGAAQGRPVAQGLPLQRQGRPQARHRLPDRADRREGRPRARERRADGQAVQPERVRRQRQRRRNARGDLEGPHALHREPDHQGPGHEQGPDLEDEVRQLAARQGGPGAEGQRRGLRHHGSRAEAPGLAATRAPRRQADQGQPHSVGARRLRGPGPDSGRADQQGRQGHRLRQRHQEPRRHHRHPRRQAQLLQAADAQPGRQQGRPGRRDRHRRQAVPERRVLPAGRGREPADLQQVQGHQRAARADRHRGRRHFAGVQAERRAAGRGAGAGLPAGRGGQAGAGRGQEGRREAAQGAAGEVALPPAPSQTAGGGSSRGFGWLGRRLLLLDRAQFVTGPVTILNGLRHCPDRR
ncbi:MAG: DUF748 domain-containing protein [Myxococcales bacterium]